MPAILLKRDPNTRFSCEYCKFFKNSCFEEHLRTAATVEVRVRISGQGVFLIPLYRKPLGDCFSMLNVFVSCHFFNLDVFHKEALQQIWYHANV